ncbi:hypothetical protein NC652_007677 [Populus alba x Populus x berolinensis]|nr:hypothetical protein NC652_007677 [Populus alba x Populus x berolinensis]
MSNTRYTSEDKSIVPMLKMLRDSKRATFLVGEHCLLFQTELEREVKLLWEQRNSNKFHEVWGQLMKTGYRNSRFAHQVRSKSFQYHSTQNCFMLLSF